MLINIFERINEYTYSLEKKNMIARIKSKYLRNKKHKKYSFIDWFFSLFNNFLKKLFFSKKI